MDNKGKSAKGSRYERKIARAIGNWWQGDEESFWRVGGSGGRAHHANVHPGDIVPAKQLTQGFPFCVECKNRESWSGDEFWSLRAESSKILKWLLKNHKKDAGEDYLSILVVTRNYHDDLVAYPNWFLHSLDKSMPIRLGLYFGNNIYPSVFITKMDWFFEQFTPKSLEGVYSGSEEFLNMKNAEKTVMKHVEGYNGDA